MFHRIVYFLEGSMLFGFILPILLFLGLFTWLMSCYPQIKTPEERLDIVEKRLKALEDR